jgi:hemerythrin-like domain-containing protein
MPIELNAAPLADFDRPIDVLEDCHRRIERFLSMLHDVVSGATSDGRLTEDAAGALQAALRYFRNAAPKHTADEEQSLFPRMRESGDPRVAEVLDQLAHLEQEHLDAQPLHDLVDELGVRWLETGVLDAPERSRMADAITRLRATYAAHIAAEDGIVFPLAREVLASDTQEQVGAEMRARRAPRPG